MNNIFNLVLIVHIISGATGLISGSINIVRKKGDRKHRLTGRFFYYGMVSAGVSSLILAFMHTNHFLFIVGVFTLYMTVSGRRYLNLKSTGSVAAKGDWMLAYSMLAVSLVFEAIGIYRLTGGENFGIVYIVFGTIGMRFSITDLRNFRGKSTIKNYWLTGHLQRMTGSYAAALTAFLVVNAKYLPPVFPFFILWLIPTLMVLPFIIGWTRKYKVKTMKT